MNRWMLVATAVIVILASTSGKSGTDRPRHAAQAPPLAAAACTAPEYRQLDFWVGDWDAFEQGSTAPVARVRVTKILEGCVLLEDYRDTGGHHGRSFSIYDAVRRVWHQTWVTNRGELLMIEGRLESGEMILSGVDPARGAKGMVRGVWKPVTGGVREIGTTSTDGGKSWQPWFDLLFRPHVE